MTTPAQTGTITTRDQVLPELTMDGTVQEYAVLTEASEPDFTLVLRCTTDAWGFSRSASGPFFPIDAGDLKFVRVTHQSMSFFVQSSGGVLSVMEDEHVVSFEDESDDVGTNVISVVGSDIIVTKDADTTHPGTTDEILDTDLTIHIGAGERWWFKTALMVKGMTDNTSSMLARLSFPDDMVSGGMCVHSVDANAEWFASQHLGLAAAFTPSTWHLTVFYDASADGTVWAEGSFTNGSTPFDLQVRWAQGDDSHLTDDRIKLMAGSYMHARRLA